MNTISVLIIEDHPLIANAYKLALNKVSDLRNFQFEIKEVSTIDTALLALEDYDEEDEIIVFLDIKLEKSNNNKFLSGEDLGMEIMRLLPKSKIIVSTTYNDNYRVSNILKSLNPDGFLIKNDLDPAELIKGIIEVIESPPYYSKTVQKLIRKHITSEILLDKIDRQILFEISIGTKMKDLPNSIPMSMGGIERRKRQIKELFDVADKEDKDLIEVAKMKGFI